MYAFSEKEKNSDQRRRYGDQLIGLRKDLKVFRSAARVQQIVNLHAIAPDQEYFQLFDMILIVVGGPSGARTPNLLIKSHVIHIEIIKQIRPSGTLVGQHENTNYFTMLRSGLIFSAIALK